MCNMMLPVLAQEMGLPASNKEGWLSGLADVILERQRENDLELAVAFPAAKDVLEQQDKILKGLYIHRENQARLKYYGFYEDTRNAEVYEEALENRLQQILADFQPDMIHCFGTEYSHTLAICRIFPRKDRILVGIQGLCAVHAQSYYADLPGRVIHSITFRDWLKKDTIIRQQQKFALRGMYEVEAVKLAGHIAGRTAWDRYYTGLWNPKARYHVLKETLRRDFYEEDSLWKEENCVPHTIFLSQGDYPIKGLHYLLKALPGIKKIYPDVRVYVAGNSVVNYHTWKEKLKLSAYGKYLRQLLREGDVEEEVIFLGPLTAEQMKEQYLHSHLFLCCSAVENSPNSLGEAMLLGMPCVSADVGGIPSLFTDGEDGILYRGFKIEDKSINNICNDNTADEENLEKVSKRLKNAVLEIWSDRAKMEQYCRNARLHAKKTHDKLQNYQDLTEIYAEITR